MKVAIIGVGYIGTRLAQRLQESGYEVTMYDREFTLFHHTLGQCMYGDWQNHTYSIRQNDFVIYLAGYSSVGTTERAMRSQAWYENVTSVLNYINHYHESVFIYASSSGVYGGLHETGYEELNKFKAMKMYDLTKWTVDSYVRYVKPKNVFGLRFGTVNGWSPTLRKDLMLNKMTLDAYEKRIITCVNPNRKRPILDIDDLCDAIGQILCKRTESTYGIYNLASYNSTVYELASAVGQLWDVGVMTDPKETPGYNMEMSWSKFQWDFDWEPERSIIHTITKLKDELHNVRSFTDRS